MRKHLKYLKKEKGMTLVELLAVLVILAIVAVIAIPLIGNIISKSDAKADVNEALNIINAAKFAYMDGVNKDETPPTYELDDLGDYLDSTTATGFTVTKDGDNWTITGHPANALDDVDDTATENDLKNWLKTNNQ